MTDVTGYRPNKTLVTAIVAACEQDGMGWYGQWRVSRALRRMSEADLLKLEKKCTALATDTGLPMGTDDIAGGCYVGDWGDGTFFQMLIDNLPKILEFIKAILPFFAMFASAIIVFFALASTAFAQCPGGTCTRPATPVRSAVQAAATVARPIVQGSSVATCGARTPKGSTPRGRFIPRLFRRGR
jgi:hypothetical protein